MRITTRFFGFVFIFCLITPFAFAQRAGRLPVDATPPINEDGEPEDMSTPIGEIKSVVDALRALNGAIRTQNDAFESLISKIDEIRLDYDKGLQKLNDKVDAVKPAEDLKESFKNNIDEAVKTAAEKWKAEKSEVVTALDDIDKALKSALERRGTENAEVVSALNDLKGQITEAERKTMTADAFALAIDNFMAKETDAFNRYFARIDASSADWRSLEQTVKEPPKTTALGWVNSAATWLAAIYASIRTIILLFGWFAKRAAGNQSLRARLASLERRGGGSTGAKDATASGSNSDSFNLL